MDEVGRLIEAFRSRGRRGHSTWKLDVLMDLAGHDDPTVVAFLREVLTDGEQPRDVRIDALRRLQEGQLAPDQRIGVANATLRVLSRPSDGELRLHAALVLGDFTDVEGVLEVLGALAMDPDEPIELRYNAFTSLQRAGPTAECEALLQALCGDETLGRGARGILAAWGAP